jgi:hypothetical protein
MSMHLLEVIRIPNMNSGVTVEDVLYDASRVNELTSTSLSLLILLHALPHVTTSATTIDHLHYYNL